MRKYLFIYLIAVISVLSLSTCKRETNECNGTCGKIYVANEGSGSITVIDASNYEVVKFIKVGDNMNMVMIHNVQASPDGNSVWATYNRMDTEESGFLTIDPLTDEITNEVLLGVGWDVAHVVFDSTSAFAYIIAADSNMVIEVNTTSLAVTRKFYVGASHSPHGMRYATGKLYVANVEGRSMSIIDVATGTVSEIPVGGMAIQTAVIPGRYAFVSLYDTKKIFSYSLSSGDTVSYSLPDVSQGPIQIYPAGTDRLLVCDQGMLLGRPSSNLLYIMNAETGEIVSAVTVGDGAHGVVSDPNGHRAYCTNRADNTICVVDVDNFRLICTIPVGVDPNGITFWSQSESQP